MWSENKKYVKLKEIEYLNNNSYIPIIYRYDGSKDTRLGVSGDGIRTILES